MGPAIVGEPTSGCDPGYLRTERINPRRRIPARGRINLEMPIMLSNEAPDGCQDAIFPFLYRTRVNVLGAGG